MTDAPHAPDPPEPARRGRLGLRPLGNALLLVAAALLMLLEQRVLDAAPDPPTPPAHLRAVLPAALAGLVLLARGRLRILVAPALLAAPALVLVADRASMLFFHEPVRFAMRAGVHQLWDVRGSVAELLSAADVALFAAVLGLSLAGGLLAARQRVRSANFRRAERLVGALLVLAALPGVLGALSRAPDRPLVFREAALASVDAHGLLLHHVIDLRATLFPPPVEPLGEDERAELLAAFAEAERLNALPSELFGVARGRHVVLLQLEALQGFALGARARNGSVTPELDALARRGLSFGHVMDTTRSGRTSDAEWQVLTGLPVHSAGPVAYTHLDDGLPSLPRALAASGYAGVTMHAYHRHFWNRATAHTAYGMGELLFREHWRPGRELAWGLSDEVFLHQAAERLGAARDPTLALVITLSTHHPYGVQPEELKGWGSGFPRGTLVDRYLRLVRYADRAVGRFVRQLEELGLDEQVLLVVYGDHDAGLDAESREFVRDRLGVDPGAAGEDRVPLLIVAPGLEPALRAAQPAADAAWGTLTDVAPTVLHLLGEPVPRGMLGTHLFVPAGERPPLPLPHGQGFVASGRLHATADAAGADLDAETRAAGAAASRWLRLTDLALDHGLPAAVASGSLALDGAAPVAGVDATWQLERGGLRPLPDDTAWVAFLGAGDADLSSWLLVDTAGGAVDLQLQWFDALGRPVAREDVTADEPRRLALARGRARHVRATGPGADTLRVQHQHAFGAAEREVPTSAAASWHWRGPARDVGTLVLAVAVPVEGLPDPDDPGPAAHVTLVAEAEGWSAERRLSLLPGAQSVLRLPCADARGELSVRLSGDAVVAELLGVSTDGTRVR